MAPTLDPLRTALASDAQKASETLREAKSSSQELLGVLQAKIDEALKTSRDVSLKAQEVCQADTLPVEYTGEIHNYRFGMVDGQPRHRFEVEVKGTGLWLCCTFTSPELDALVLTANPPIDLFSGDEIEGTSVTVKRDVKLGRMVPITFGGTRPVGPVLLKDLKGNDVRADDEVSIRETRDSYSRSFKAVVQGYDAQSGRVTVLQKRQKNPKKFRVSALYKFERTEADVLSVGSSGTPEVSPEASLFTDAKGNPVMTGDVVRLYDEYPDGRVAGEVIRFTGQTVAVKRFGREEEWFVSPSQVRKIIAEPLGNDANELPLVAGQRIKTAGSAKGDTPGVVIAMNASETSFFILRDDRKLNDIGREYGGAYNIDAKRVIGL